MTKQQLEEMTLKFLREHDEQFLKKNKNKIMEYPYLSKRQDKRRRTSEIPLSNLSNRQKQSCSRFGDCLDYGGVR